MSSGKELCSDILQPIPLEEWPVLQELLTTDWPLYANYYYWVGNCIRWKKLEPNFDLEIYCPHGKYQDDATFVGIWNFPVMPVVVFTKESSGKKLYEAMVQTNRFDWTRQVRFMGLHEYIQPTVFAALDTLRSERGIEINFAVPGCFYIKPADEAATVEIKVPEECYIADLNKSHASVIHSVWPHFNRQDPKSSMRYLEIIMTLNNSVGLFLKEGDVLVSWAIHSDWGGLMTVQTLEPYRRRGYAKIVVNALAKRLGKEGTSPVLFVVDGNKPSEDFFTSLNWKRNVPATWLTTKTLEPSNT